MESDRSIQLLGRALDAAMMRQTAITQNISQLDNKNYGEIQVNFEEQLVSNPEAYPIFHQSSEHPTLDNQIIKSLSNAMQFKVLIKGLNHKFSVMKLALQGINT